MTILKTEEEMAEDTQRILAGQEPTQASVNTVQDVPAAFKDWVKDHSDRIETAGNLPYFIRDNRAAVSRIIGGNEIVATTAGTIPQSIVLTKLPASQTTRHSKIKAKSSESESATLYTMVDSIEGAIARAESYGISSVDFSDASIDEINIILEVFHYAHQDYGINLNKLRLARNFNKKEHWAGSYHWGNKTLTLDLEGFKKSSYQEAVNYGDKIAKLQSNKASLLRQIEQSEAHLGRSKASDRILKGDIKAIKSRMLDIDLRIKKFEELIKNGYNELPLTVADTFKEIKEQMQARIWHEIGHHIDDRLGCPKFAEGNLISEYAKEMRAEEFAEWFSQYKMRGAKDVPADLLRIFRNEEYKRYGERKWDQLFFDVKSGGYNVAHDLHQFRNTRPKGVPRTGGQAERWLGKQLAKQGKAIEFLPESGICGKAGDMRFDGKVWDCKYIPLANVNTIRTCIKDARKADNVIFCWDEESRLEDLRLAISSEVGNFKKQNRINELPDIYWADATGQLHLLWKK